MKTKALKKRFSLLPAIKALLGKEKKTEKVDEKLVEKFNQDVETIRNMLSVRHSEAEYAKRIREENPLQIKLERQQIQQLEQENNNLDRGEK